MMKKLAAAGLSAALILVGPLAAFAQNDAAAPAATDAAPAASDAGAKPAAKPHKVKKHHAKKEHKMKKMEAAPASGSDSTAAPAEQKQQ